MITLSSLPTVLAANSALVFILIRLRNIEWDGDGMLKKKGNHVGETASDALRKSEIVGTKSISL